MHLLLLLTYAALSELFGVDGRGEVESPRVVGRSVLPVDEALGRLPYPRACNEEDTETAGLGSDLMGDLRQIFWEM